ncbi:MAG: PBP1A family penicillin-binding protein [Candidatus Latescibacteria bacterium]|nr:PBP1A family penicillin-binding protein [Candidatus Latescibacterota bacterium]
MIISTRTWIRGLLLLFLLFDLAVVGFVGVYRYYSRQLPRDLTAIQDYDPSVLSQVYAADGSVIGEFFIQRRVVVQLDSIPKVVIQAFMASEDARFFEHGGVDYLRILKAFARNLSPRRRPQGGSTITQQIAREFFLNREVSYTRKIKEAILAYRIERELSKSQILHLYLNQQYLGHGAYGVEAASQNYFGQHVSEIGLAEAAMLAGLLKAPSYYSPHTNFNGAKNRQIYVLRRMYEEGFISLREAQRAAEQEIRIVSWEDINDQVAPYFVEYVRKYVRAKYGSDSVYKDGLQIYTGLDIQIQKAANRTIQEGLRDLDQGRGFRGVSNYLKPGEVEPFLRQQTEEIRRAKVGIRSRRGVEARLDVGEKYQAVVSDIDDRIRLRIGSFKAILDEEGSVWAKRVAVAEGVSAERSLRGTLKPGDVVEARIQQYDRGRYIVTLDQDPRLQGALIAIDPSNGCVRALVGGYDYNKSEFDRAIQARRQPGSAFKPIVYSAAIDSLGYTQTTVVLDAPVTIGGWSPRNFQNKFLGPQPLRNALAKSLNSVSVRLAERLGPKSIVDRARRLGITSPLAQNLTIALGSSGVSLLELTNAYTVFAAGGRKIEPVFITMIRGRNGETLEDNRFVNGAGEESPVSDTGPTRTLGTARPSAVQYAVSPQTAYVMTNMLQAVVQRGTATKVKELGRPAAGKTGTNGLTDVWFVGYTPELVAGIWVGYDDLRPLGSKYTGGHVAAPIWLRFMKEALEGKPLRDFAVPDGIVFNYLGAGNTPADPMAGGERVAFKSGTERFPEQGFRRDEAQVQGGHFQDRFAREPAASLQRRRPDSEFQF